MYRIVVKTREDDCDHLSLLMQCHTDCPHCCRIVVLNVPPFAGTPLLLPPFTPANESAAAQVRICCLCAACTCVSCTALIFHITGQILTLLFVQMSCATGSINTAHQPAGCKMHSNGFTTTCCQTACINAYSCISRLQVAWMHHPNERGSFALCISNVMLEPLLNAHIMLTRAESTLYWRTVAMFVFQLCGKAVFCVALAGFGGTADC